ncbi:hypothetical protein BCR34DRAFT_597263 [Clohesyomyces aquaticus]|uniref:Uncharacterized protein n=1 Tax=Clohesyomyces aquaticus TaxID=1231657 RepID=A0A1Y2A2X1_9PLEO|nr:hypothetical protein BCR34DRAFT_597263 [Clohesyomyces aquaticus]
MEWHERYPQEITKLSFAVVYGKDMLERTLGSNILKLLEKAMVCHARVMKSAHMHCIDNDIETLDENFGVDLDDYGTIVKIIDIKNVDRQANIADWVALHSMLNMFSITGDFRRNVGNDIAIRLYSRFSWVFTRSSIPPAGPRIAMRTRFKDASTSDRSRNYAGRKTSSCSEVGSPSLLLPLAQGRHNKKQSERASTHMDSRCYSQFDDATLAELASKKARRDEVYCWYEAALVVDIAKFGLEDDRGR